MILRLFAAAVPLLWSACAALPPPSGTGTSLKPCPDTPNCVSSRESDPARRIDPLPLHGTAAEGLAAVRKVVLDMPRARVTAEGAGFLHAEFRSLVFRFVDDVELVVDEAAGVVHVRSAARVGRYDFGVNRRRVEEIRDRLATMHEPDAKKQSSAAAGNR